MIDPFMKELVEEFVLQTEKAERCFRNAAAVMAEEQLFRQFESEQGPQTAHHALSNRHLGVLRPLPRTLVAAISAGAAGAASFALTELLLPHLPAVVAAGASAGFATVFATRLLTSIQTKTAPEPNPDADTVIIDASPHPSGFSDYLLPLRADITILPAERDQDDCSPRQLPLIGFDSERSSDHE